MIIAVDTNILIDIFSVDTKFGPASAQAFRQCIMYKRRKRDRVVADFLIGAHALTQCDRLLTRDRGFYRSYFRTLNIIDPAEKRSLS